LCVISAITGELNPVNNNIGKNLFIVIYNIPSFIYYYFKLTLGIVSYDTCHICKDLLI